MNGRAGIVLRLAALLTATALVAALTLAWDLRPSLPPLPRSFSEPLPSSTISGTLDLAAWAVFVLLDVVLFTNVIKLAIRRTPKRGALRLRRAFAASEKSPVNDTHWRKHSAPLAPPVLLIPTRHDAEPRSERVQPEREVLLEVAPAHATAEVDRTDKRAGIRMLGPFELAGCKKKRPRRQATAELLAYLAIQQRPVSRDELLEALWPGDDPHRSASRFYQAASEARKLLGEAFVRERDTYALDGEQVWIDLQELDRLRAEAEAAKGEHQRALLEGALALFRGQPLAGIDALWTDSEVRRLCAMQVELLERVGRVRLEAGEKIAALEAAEVAHVLDPSNERPVEVAMKAEAALGRREAVVARYERLCRELDEQFGLEPSRELKALYRRLLSQDEVTASSGAGAA
jgi:DNA-binding SARP family transcriptional activator